MLQEPTVENINSSLFQDTIHRIYFKNSQKMKEVCDGAVHLVVTSPPYWNIKDYGNPNQIGFHDTLPTYIKRLRKVWSECIRVLAPGCRMCINIGDVYLRADEQTPYQIVPLHAYVVNSIMNKHVNDVVYLGSIMWKKIPTTHTSGGANVMGSYGYPRNGYVSYNYEYIAIFKKKGKAPKPERSIKEKAKIENEEWRLLFNGIWEFVGAKQDEHIAMFPDELPKRLMRMFTFQGDTVLDPFLGSGTTTKVAWELGRNSIGYEIGFGSTPETKRIVKAKVHFEDTPFDIRHKVFPTLT